MARTISDEDIRLNIIVNGNPAQKQLLDLEKSTRSYKKANTELNKERTKLIQLGQKESQEYKNLTKEIKANNAIIKQNEINMSALRKEIGITGLTMNQLKQRASVLRLSLQHAIPGGEDEKRYNAELKQISARLTELKAKGQETKISLSGVANGFNKYAALGASAIAATTGVVIGMQKMIDYNGKLSDAQADVQKTTGLTKIEVDELTKSFGLLNTRTSRIDLLKIAEEGGRIGIAKNEIQQFVAVMNKANVALGDSFTGGVEEVASKLGKLKLLFKETKDIGVEQAYESIGSAINELGANGVATESNIAEFATRLGSLPDALKPSISEALALGAAFEESGVEAEISARSYSIFLGEASTRLADFGKIMGISAAEVENLINTNPTEFFLQFAQKLEETSKGGVDTAITLGKLGLSADGVKKIVGAAGNNVDRFREMLDLSNKSMVDATSLTNEYNIKNNNLAANIEKIQKKMTALFSSEFIMNGLGTFVNWFAKFIGVTEDSDGSVTNFKNKLIAFIKTVLIVTTGIISYKAALQLATFWTNRATVGTASYNLIQKATAITTGLLRGITLLSAAAYNLVTGNITRARAAMQLFNLTAKLNPIGLLVGLVAAATVAYIAFSESAKKAATKQSLLNDAKNKASIDMVSQRENLKLLLEIANNENLSLERRQKAVDKLNELVPDYNKNLTIQTANTLEATKVLDNFIAAKEREILADIFLEDWKKKLQEQKKAESASLTENIQLHEHLWNTLKNLGNVTGTAADNVKTATANRKEHIDVLKEETKTALELYKAQVSINDNAGSGNKDLGKPKEGDVKYFNGQKFIFKGGDWVFQKQSGGGTGEGEETEEEKQIKASKARIEQFLKEWHADQALQKTLREEGEEAAEIEKKSLEFDKLILEAENDNRLKTELEEAKNTELQAIRDKWSDVRLKNKKEEDEKFERLDNESKAALKKAEEDLAQAKRDALIAGIGFLKNFAKEGTALHKTLFAIEKAVAIADVIIKGIAERAAISATWGSLPMVAAPMLLASKIRTGINVATIAGTAIQGFEEGLYPITRSQDGKNFNATYGGALTSGLVDRPTVFSTPKGNILTGEKGKNEPELIVDGAAFKQINPNIRGSFMREIARIKGFETGLYQPQSFNESSQNGVNNSTSSAIDAKFEVFMSLVAKNNELLDVLIKDGVSAYLSNDLKTAKQIQENITDYNNLISKNKR